MWLVAEVAVEVRKGVLGLQADLLGVAGIHVLDILDRHHLLELQRF